MQHFQKLLEIARLQGFTLLLPLDPDPKREPVRDVEWEYFAQCEPFVFGGEEAPIDSTLPKYVDITAGLDDKTPLDAPFKVFSIECLNGALDKFELFDKSSPGGEAIAFTLCIVTIEVHPGQYGYYELVEYRDRRNNQLYYAVWKATTSGLTVKHYVDRLNKEKLGVETTRATVKIGTGKSKRVHRIRRVIHVSPKKYMHSQEYSSRHVDWSHRWEVRGHWVHLPGKLGKDRDGNYCVKDWTWRKEHVKGPEHLPVVKKVRVVTDE